METPRCSEIPNLSAEWKLDPNVECRIILNKFKIEAPEYGAMEFCRTLTNKTKDMGFHFKSEFVLDVLWNEILGKCEDKCEVCEKYVQQLRHHIHLAHAASPDAQNVFKCDVCSSIYSSPSMLIRHRNTHSDNQDTLTTPCSNELERVRFDSNNISTSFVISPLTTKNESVNSGHCANHPHQPVAVPPLMPLNVDWNSLKQEPSESQSEIEISNPNPLGILQHVNHLSTIQNNLKQECNESESQCQEYLMDPLLLQDVDLQVPSFVKYECRGISNEPEHRATLMTHEKSSNDTPPRRENFPVPSDLIRQRIIQSSQMSHKCDTCGKCFRTLQHLTQHKLTHTGEKSNECDVCGKCFSERYNLNKHKLVHTGEKRHKCDVCGKCFALHADLARHKLIHTGVRPYGCDVCEMSFRRSAHLTLHKLTHTGEKPHKCDVCGKCFARKYALGQHKRTHTGETSFHCDVCGQRFDGRHELIKHKLKHDWQNTTATFVNHLKEEEECQEDPLLNLHLDVPS